MTLQERLLASAKELVQLLEESQKEHEEKIRERDRKLLGEWDNSAEEIKLPGGLGLILYVDAKSREVVGFEVSLPDGSAFQPPIDKLYKAIEAMTPPCLKIDGAEMHKAACREAEQREAALMGSEKLKGASHHQCLCPMGLYIDGAKLHQVIRNLELKFQL